MLIALPPVLVHSFTIWWLVAYCFCSLNELGSDLSERSFGERWRSCRRRHRRARSIVSCDRGAAPWKTIGETVMLFCPSLAARVSALTCLLHQSLGWVSRCSSSHLCSGSHTRKERCRPLGCVRFHRPAYTSWVREDRSHAWRFLDCSERLLREASGSSGSLMNEEARTVVVPRKALSILVLSHKKA